MAIDNLSFKIFRLPGDENDVVVKLLPDVFPLFLYLLLGFVYAGEVHVVFICFFRDEEIPKFELRPHWVAVIVDEKLIHTEG